VLRRVAQRGTERGPSRERDERGTCASRRGHSDPQPARASLRAPRSRRGVAPAPRRKEQRSSGSPRSLPRRYKRGGGGATEPTAAPQLRHMAPRPARSAQPASTAPAASGPR
jgi:hypothetical protein